MRGKSVHSGVILLSVFSVSLAAVGLGPATVHESHPDQCYNDKSDSYFSPGEFWSLEGCGRATCEKFSQSSSQLMISYESCGIASVLPPCYIVQDNTKAYPLCCNQVVCPESNDDENEKFDPSSSEEEEYTLSGRNRTVNDLAGTAVHFSLAQEEDNAVDRSDRNELDSFEDEQDKPENVEEPTYEIIQPRTIPFRFQFAHKYDIGSDHEQRLNDVDAQEDYQLV
ncbi:unnamed protein product [Orchesella dallaii]|uniref:Single domain-containing protein n=1 Tax=Orchesella dallaii TaxID=48710 RepID=A0ABP1R022_9HEXA